jgi:hypothetical protein
MIVAKFEFNARTGGSKMKTKATVIACFLAAWLFSTTANAQQGQVLVVDTKDALQGYQASPGALCIAFDPSTGDTINSAVTDAQGVARIYPPPGEPSRLCTAMTRR